MNLNEAISSQQPLIIPKGAEVRNSGYSSFATLRDVAMIAMMHALVSSDPGNAFLVDADAVAARAVKLVEALGRAP